MGNVIVKFLFVVILVICFVFLLTGKIIDFNRFLTVLSTDFTNGEFDGFDVSGGISSFIGYVRSFPTFIPKITADWTIVNFGVFGDTTFNLSFNFIRDAINAITGAFQILLKLAFIVYASIAYLLTYALNFMELFFIS